MLLGFQTNDMISAKAAMLVYAIYRSRDKRRGPSGTDMWGQIERFARSSAKRARGVGEFVGAFKRRMACDAINPRWMDTGILPTANDYGEIVVIEGKRQFLPDIFESRPEEQEEIVQMIYAQTARIVLLVRARLEDEKPIEAKFVQEDESNE